MFLNLLSAAILSANTSPIEKLQAPVTVTAQRSPRTIEQSLASVEILERADLIRMQAQDVPELLRRMVGVDVSRNGGPGGQTSVFLRGSNSNHVLVLLDGVRVASSTTGGFSWEQLPVSHIERIEIVRGPRAALYGSDAIGGVIQIFTRSGLAPSIELTAGSQRDGELALGQGFGSEENNVHIAASRRDRRGFSAQNEAGFGFNPDRDGVQSNRLSVHASFALGDRGQLGLTGLGTDNEIEFDQGVSDSAFRSAGVTLQWRGSDLSHELRVGHTREALSTPAFDSRFSTRRQQFDWLGSWTLGAGQSLTAGLSYLGDRGTSSNQARVAAYSETRNSKGALLKYALSQAAFSLDAIARWDDYDGFGSTGTGQFALGYALDTTTLRLSWGQGFRAPNLNELYSPGFGGSFAGNALLDPERSRTLELGAYSSLGERHSLDAVVYQSDVRDLIAFSGPRFQAINIRRADIVGAELAWRWDRSDMDGSEWRVAHTWLEAKDGTSNQPLLRRARSKFVLESDWAIAEAWQLGATAQYVSSRLDVGSTRLSGYALLDLRASFQFRSGWFLDTRVDNVLEEDYELTRGFNTPGREFSVRVRYGL